MKKKTKQKKKKLASLYISAYRVDVQTPSRKRKDAKSVRSLVTTELES